MNFKEILELIDKVADRGISGVEIEQAGTKIRIEGKPSQAPVIHSYVPDVKGAPPVLPAPIPLTALPAAAPQAAAPAPAAPAPAAPQAEEPEAGSHVITAPIVGTFYRAANPEAEPHVNVGSRVKKGQVLCIIEAMKLMNDIESDVDGVITAIHPQNGQPVEFGQNLFSVKVS